MIGKTERKEKDYKSKLISLVTFAFVKAHCEGKVSLEDMWLKNIRMSKTDIINFMDEEVSRQLFKREICASGMIYQLTPKAKFMRLEDVNEVLKLNFKKKKKA